MIQKNPASDFIPFIRFGSSCVLAVKTIVVQIRPVLNDARG